MVGSLEFSAEHLRTNQKLGSRTKPEAILIRVDEAADHAA